MFKSFAAITLPITVLALGDNSGVDAENAISLELLNGNYAAEVGDPIEYFKMTLNYYNTYDEAE